MFICIFYIVTAYDCIKNWSICTWTTNTELFQCFDEASFGITWRWLREMLFRQNLYRMSCIILFKCWQLRNILFFSVFINSTKTWEDHTRACRFKCVIVMNVQFNGSGFILLRCHLARHKTIPNQCI